MFKSLKHKILNFHKDSRAAILVLTVFVAVPIILTIAVAVDFSRWQLAKRTLQNGIDAAAIAIAKQPDFTQMSQENAEAIAREYISFYLRDASVLTNDNKESLTVNVTLIPNEGSVQVNAGIDLDKTLLLFNNRINN